MKHLPRPRSSPSPIFGYALALMLFALGCDDPGSDTSDATDAVLDTSDADTAVLCGATACLDGQLCCRERCVDPRTDPTHCGACEAPCLRDEVCLSGACGRSCEVAADDCRPGELCAAGRCVSSCPVGTVACGARCVDRLSDPDHCGACDAACDVGEVCSRGGCQALCEPGELRCGDACVRPERDPANCGDCGVICGADEVCALGRCASSCPEGRVDCGGACVELRGDPGHCGACGQACAPDERCSNGLCVASDCGTGLLDCGGHCVDASSSEAHCGACGLFCAPGAVCTGGVCATTCLGATCGEDCVDLDTSRTHCGACGMACGVGQRCEAGACVCDAGFGDCDGDPASGCETDLGRSDAHCGACGVTCEAEATRCEGGACGCEEGRLDCDGDPANGCEASGERCGCTPGTSQSCYTGPEATRRQGVCRDGTQTCPDSGLDWGPCVGERLPGREICDNDIDENCSGVADDGDDLDGDGWRSCDGGDCCDRVEEGCEEPAAVSPSSFDFPDDGLDNDCDGETDNAPAAPCSERRLLTDLVASDLARAMEICDDASEDPRRYGLVSASLTLANGLSQPTWVQTAVLDDFGLLVSPRAGGTFAVLSSGTARDVGDDDYIHPQDVSFADFTSVVNAPTDYLAANGGLLQSVPGCPTGELDVYDSVRLNLELRAPRNARGVAFDLRFFSSEYPEFLCSSYNDFFLALLDSGATGLPEDGNISFDARGNPISVNNLFFTTCEAQGCGYTFEGADTDLDGCPDSQTCTADALCATDPDAAVCAQGASELAGFMSEIGDAGATAWLTTRAPILAGETFTLSLVIWDSTDHDLDSTVLLDNLRWLEVEPGVSTED